MFCKSLLRVYEKILDGITDAKVFKGTLINEHFAIFFFPSCHSNSFAVIMWSTRQIGKIFLSLHCSQWPCLPRSTMPCTNVKNEVNNNKILFTSVYINNYSNRAFSSSRHPLTSTFHSVSCTKLLYYIIYYLVTWTMVVLWFLSLFVFFDIYLCIDMWRFFENDHFMLHRQNSSMEWHEGEYIAVQRWYQNPKTNLLTRDFPMGFYNGGFSIDE